MDHNEPVLPDYDGACTSNVVRPLVEDPARAPDWMPPAVRDADQVVVLVLDGLGWNQMQERVGFLRGLTAMDAVRITTVAPTTTATALTSICTGLPPGEHGIIGYRMQVESDVLNVLRWSTSKGDARESLPPESIQHEQPFEGHRPPVVVRAEFRRTRNFDYIRAAQALGVSDRGIIFRHMLPNAVVATLTFLPFILCSSITTLTSLDFLGFGLPLGSPSLGELLLQGKNNLQAPWLGITAFLSVAVLLSLLIFIGEAVRDAFDPNKAV